MRIISGWAKGRKLIPPPAQGNLIRPTSDRARESLFNIIAGRTQGASVLDLFAGTGALGLEALSRGAESVCFVDCHPQALTLINRNVQICQDAFNHRPEIQHDNGSGQFKNSRPVTLIKHDLRRGLPMFSKYLPSCSGFDLIFIDPPYSQGLSSLLLRALDTSSWLRQQTLLIVEERSSETLPQDLITLSLMDQRKYGDTGFWFYQPLPTSPTS
ncbi:MAG TPA: 16S rRNA (guanine(966)-N(2))-methyltransferase RsmD [Sphaerochaeta sp.]|nr:16S rRNA (guanine(966)-N(2))-methyltransferase RsmD [Sphaerochaeta sp.]